MAFNFNPCPAELVVPVFHSFEAGIGNAIPASNDEKYLYFKRKNSLLQYWIFGLTKQVPKTVLLNSVIFILISNTLYMVPAPQELTTA